MKKIIAYKGFDKDLKCRGFQYEVGKSYKHEGEVKVCEQGFHACENPFDVLDFYDISNGNRFAEVELSGKMEREDKKIVAGQIKIKAELGFPAFINRAINFLIDLCKFDLKNKEMEQSSGDYAQIGSSGNSAKIGSSGYAAQIGSSGNSAKIGSSGYAAQIGSSGDYAQIGSSGNSAKIGSSGNSAQIGSSGNSAKIGSSGDSAQIGSSGNSAKIGSSGDSAQIGSSGDAAQIGSSGNSAKIGSSGYAAQIGSSGNDAQITCEGQDCVVAAIGFNSCVKGKKGTWITLAEYDNEGKPVCVKTEHVDGKKIKEDVFYCLKNGAFKEVN